MSCGHARLWESTSDMQRRFGSPDESKNEDSPYGVVAGCILKSYERDGVLCFAYFQDSACICEAYARVDREWLSEAQLQAVLQANQFGKEWHHERSASGESVWFKDDKSARASTSKVSGEAMRYVIFATPRFDEAIASERKAKDEAERRGASFLSAPAGTMSAPPPSTALIQRADAAGASGTKTFVPTTTHISMPPYPLQTRAAHLTGSGYASATFDSSGHCASVTMIQSTGSGVLDNNTVSYGKANWSGPPNQTVKVPVAYRLQ